MLYFYPDIANQGEENCLLKVCITGCTTGPPKSQRPGKHAFRITMATTSKAKRQKDQPGKLILAAETSQKMREWMDSLTFAADPINLSRKTMMMTTNSVDLSSSSSSSASDNFAMRSLPVFQHNNSMQRATSMVVSSSSSREISGPSLVAVKEVSSSSQRHVSAAATMQMSELATNIDSNNNDAIIQSISSEAEQPEQQQQQETQRRPSVPPPIQVPIPLSISIPSPTKTSNTNKEQTTPEIKDTPVTSPLTSPISSPIRQDQSLYSSPTKSTSEATPPLSPSNQPITTTIALPNSPSSYVITMPTLTEDGDDDNAEDTENKSTDLTEFFLSCGFGPESVPEIVQKMQNEGFNSLSELKSAEPTDEQLRELGITKMRDRNLIRKALQQQQQQQQDPASSTTTGSSSSSSLLLLPTLSRNNSSESLVGYEYVISDWMLKEGITWKKYYFCLTSQGQLRWFKSPEESVTIGKKPQGHLDIVGWFAEIVKDNKKGKIAFQVLKSKIRARATTQAFGNNNNNSGGFYYNDDSFSDKFNDDSPQKQQQQQKISKLVVATETADKRLEWMDAINRIAKGDAYYSVIPNAKAPLTVAPSPAKTNQSETDASVEENSNSSIKITGTKLDNPRLSGYLQMESKSKKWKSKFFVCSGGGLSWYDNEVDVENDIPNGYVALLGASITPPKTIRVGRYAFRLCLGSKQSGNKNKIILAAANVEERRRWQNALKEEIYWIENEHRRISTEEMHRVVEIGGPVLEGVLRVMLPREGTEDNATDGTQVRRLVAIEVGPEEAGGVDIGPRFVVYRDREGKDVAAGFMLSRVKKVGRAREVTNGIRVVFESKSLPWQGRPQQDLDFVKTVLPRTASLEVSDRKKRNKTFSRCVIASDVVGWLQREAIAASRDAAIHICRRLIRVFAMHHVMLDEEFNEDNSLFRVGWAMPVWGFGCKEVVICTESEEDAVMWEEKLRNFAGILDPGANSNNNFGLGGYCDNPDLSVLEEGDEEKVLRENIVQMMCPKGKKDWHNRWCTLTASSLLIFDPDVEDAALGGVPVAAITQVLRSKATPKVIRIGTMPLIAEKKKSTSPKDIVWKWSLSPLVKRVREALMNHGHIGGGGSQQQQQQQQQQTGMEEDHSFKGFELIDWLIDVGLANSRDAGVKIGKRLIKEFVLRHVSNEFSFLDNRYLYVWTWDHPASTVLVLRVETEAEAIEWETAIRSVVPKKNCVFREAIIAAKERLPDSVTAAELETEMCVNFEYQGTAIPSTQQMWAELRGSALVWCRSYEDRTVVGGFHLVGASSVSIDAESSDIIRIQVNNLGDDDSWLHTIPCQEKDLVIEMKREAEISSLKSYFDPKRNVIAGWRLVDWLVANEYCENRTHAAAFCRHLMEIFVLHSTDYSCGFADDKSEFRLVWMEAPMKSITLRAGDGTVACNWEKEMKLRRPLPKGSAVEGFTPENCTIRIKEAADAVFRQGERDATDNDRLIWDINTWVGISQAALAELTKNGRLDIFEACLRGYHDQLVSVTERYLSHANKTGTWSSDKTNELMTLLGNAESIFAEYDENGYCEDRSILKNAEVLYLGKATAQLLYTENCQLVDRLVDAELSRISPPVQNSNGCLETSIMLDLFSFLSRSMQFVAKTNNKDFLFSCVKDGYLPTLGYFQQVYSGKIAQEKDAGATTMENLIVFGNNGVSGLAHMETMREWLLEKLDIEAEYQLDLRLSTNAFREMIRKAGCFISDLLLTSLGESASLQTLVNPETEESNNSLERLMEAIAAEMRDYLPFMESRLARESVVQTVRRCLLFYLYSLTHPKRKPHPNLAERVLRDVHLLRSTFESLFQTQSPILKRELQVMDVVLLFLSTPNPEHLKEHWVELCEIADPTTSLLHTLLRLRNDPVEVQKSEATECLAMKTPGSIQDSNSSKMFCFIPHLNESAAATPSAMKRLSFRFTRKKTLEGDEDKEAVLANILDDGTRVDTLLKKCLSQDTPQCCVS